MTNTKIDVLFKDQALQFLVDSQSRRKSPVKGATARAYASHINKMLPLLGNVPLSGIRNGIAKELVEKLSSEGMKPASILAIFNVLKMIVASAVNEEGDALFPVIWNHRFIDLPEVIPGSQKAPTIAVNSIQEAIRRAKPVDKALYALLAGTGLRIGEALALRLCGRGSESVWYPVTKLIVVRETLSGGKIQSTTKTLAGQRAINISTELNDYLIKNLMPYTSQNQFLFQSYIGGLVRIKSAYQTLAANGIKEGFHAFRRFRVTHLRSQNTPEELIQFWIGHAKAGITDRYSRLAENLEFRKEWAEKVGLGFQLEGL